MNSLKRCELCRYGIPTMDVEGTRYVTCAILPPTVVVISNISVWVRPPMTLTGFCGQFKLSWWKTFFGNGSRT